MRAAPPPGLTGSPKETSAGGTADWQPIPHIKLFTNAFVFSVDGTKVLLGYKKRGFGKDLWNGFGGKVEPTETPLQAACRELQEEAGVDAPLQKAGTLLFTTAGTPYAFHIDIFRSDSYTGRPVETDEMRPAWFSISPTAIPSSDVQRGPNDTSPPPAIPYSRMWADDEHWFPLMIARRPFVGRADFSIDQSGAYVMQRFWFGTTDSDVNEDAGPC